MTIDILRKAYVDLFTLEPADQGALETIERELDLTLPRDFHDVTTFYSGGILGGISHHAIANDGSANNVAMETKRLRDVVKLPISMVVLAEPPESLIVLVTDHRHNQPAVVWLDNSDVSRLNDLASLHQPQVWTSYFDFFEHLLNRELEELT